MALTDEEWKRVHGAVMAAYDAAVGDFSDPDDNTAQGIRRTVDSILSRAKGETNLWRNVVRDALGLGEGDPDPNADVARRTLMNRIDPTAEPEVKSGDIIEVEVDYSEFHGRMIYSKKRVVEVAEYIVCVAHENADEELIRLDSDDWRKPES